MHRTAIICSVLLALVLSCAQAGVVLTYKMKKGDVLRYQCETTGDGVIQATVENGPLTMSSRFQYVLTCDDVDTAGNMTITHRVESLQVQAVWNGENLPVEVNIPPVTMKITPGGKVLATNVTRAATDQGGGLSLNDAIAQRTQFDVGQFFGDLKGPGFPTQAVEPGSRWKEDVTLNTQSGQPIVVNTTTAFLDYAKLNGVPCARLQTSYTMPLDLSVMGLALFKLSGKHTGSQVAYFDYGQGRALRFDGIADTEMVMQTPQLFGGAGANQTMVSMNLRSNTTVTLVTQ